MTSNNQTKDTYHHGDLASTLIRATIGLLAAKGPESISLREVARIAGVSHGAPAHHFGGKSGLLLAVAIDGHQLLAESLEQAIKRKRTPITQLTAAGEAYILFAIAHPGHFSIMFQSEHIDRTSRDYQKAIARTKGCLQLCVASLPNTPNQEAKRNAIVTALWSQVHGFSTLWMAGNFGDPTDKKLLAKLLPEMLSSIEPKLS